MQSAARWTVALLLPIVLILSNVRLLLTPGFVRLEFSRPGLPAPYMFDPALRWPAAETAVNAVLGRVPLERLAELPDGRGGALFNAREIGHLADVRWLVAWTFEAQWLAVLLLLFVALALIYAGRPHEILRGLYAGSVLTVAIVGSVAVMIALSFDATFVAFHRIFFTGETWLFPPTDTLFQLFPEAFWADAAVVLVGLTVLEAAVIGGLCYRWLSTADRRRGAPRGLLTGRSSLASRR